MSSLHAATFHTCWTGFKEFEIEDQEDTDDNEDNDDNGEENPLLHAALFLANTGDFALHGVDLTGNDVHLERFLVLIRASLGDGDGAVLKMFCGCVRVIVILIAVTVKLHGWSNLEFLVLTLSAMHLYTITFFENILLGRFLDLLLDHVRAFLRYPYVAQWLEKSMNSKKKQLEIM